MEQNSSIFSFKVLRTPLIIVGLYLAVEIIYRLFTFGSYAALNWKTYNPHGILLADISMPVADADISWKLKPNVKTTYKTRPFSTNSFGFRNPEIERTKDPDVTRIVFLGRSITMGSGVADGESYPDVLGKLLEAWEPGAFEVINCAVEGYSLTQMFASYDKYISELKPDMVFVLVSKMDMYIKQLEPIPAFQDVQPAWSNLKARLHYTFLYKALTHMVKGFTWRFFATDWDERVEGIYSTAADTLTREIILTRFIKARHQEQIQTYLVLPKRKALRYGGAAEVLKGWIKELDGVTYLDIDDYMKPRTPKNAYIYFGDTHPNSDVHRLYAEAIFNHFKSGTVKR